MHVKFALLLQLHGLPHLTVYREVAALLSVGIVNVASIWHIQHGILLL